MMSFFILFSLVTIVFFLLSGVTFFGDDVKKGLVNFSDNRKLANEQRLARKREIVALQAQGVDLLEEQHLKVIQDRRALRRKEVSDWERAFAGEDENVRYLEGTRYALSQGDDYKITFEKDKSNVLPSSEKQREPVPVLASGTFFDNDYTVTTKTMSRYSPDGVVRHYDPKHPRHDQPDLDYYRTLKSYSRGHMTASVFRASVGNPPSQVATQDWSKMDELDMQGLI